MSLPAVEHRGRRLHRPVGADTDGNVCLFDRLLVVDVPTGRCGPGPGCAVTVLSCLRLNLAVRECRADLRNVLPMHRRIMSMFPDPAAGQHRRTFGVLWRAETSDTPTLMLQSSDVPDFSVLPGRYAVCEHASIDRRLFKHRNRQIVRYRILGCPVRHSGDGRSGQADTVPITEPTEWWRAVSSQAGLACISTPVPVMVPVRPLRVPGDDRLLHVCSAWFDGLAEIVDADRVRAAVKGGVGGAKAYGCGLLTVAPLAENMRRRRS